MKYMYYLMCFFCCHYLLLCCLWNWWYQSPCVHVDCTSGSICGPLPLYLSEFTSTLVSWIFLWELVQCSTVTFASMICTFKLLDCMFPHRHILYFRYVRYTCIELSPSPMKRMYSNTLHGPVLPLWNPQKILLVSTWDKETSQFL